MKNRAYHVFCLFARSGCEQLYTCGEQNTPSVSPGKHSCVVNAKSDRSSCMKTEKREFEREAQTLLLDETGGAMTTHRYVTTWEENRLLSIIIQHLMSTLFWTYWGLYGRLFGVKNAVQRFWSVFYSVKKNNLQFFQNAAAWPLTGSTRRDCIYHHGT